MHPKTYGVKDMFRSRIALPLQRQVRDQGNSVFLDERLSPWPDQWAFLASVSRVGRDHAERLAQEAEHNGRILGVRLPPDEDDDTPWTVPPSRRHKEAPVTGVLPKSIEIVQANQLYIPKDGLNPGLRNRLLRVAAFQNPEFYAAQAMRLSTFGKPRVVACAEDHPHHIGLPRGCLDDVRAVLHNAGVQVALRDERQPGTNLDLRFHGELRVDQQRAADAMLRHDTGVLAATTAWMCRLRSCLCTQRAQCRLMPKAAARARSATEEFLFRRLETLAETRGRFVLNESLAIPFDQQGRLEVDLLCADARVAVELDGGQHLGDPEAYRRDRRKDQLLQEHGYFVLRFLAEDVGKCLEQVLDTILRVVP